VTRSEFDALLGELGLSQAEAARLLSVDPRTVRRWAENPAEIPGPAEQALRAWRTLHRFGLPWAPGSVDLVRLDPDQIAKQRAHAIELEALLNRVQKRGGPALPWDVDLEHCRATHGKLEVTFYRLANGGFSPQSYRRRDGIPADLERDWPLIEDAFVHVARAIAGDRRKQRAR